MEGNERRQWLKVIVEAIKAIKELIYDHLDGISEEDWKKTAPKEEV